MRRRRLTARPAGARPAAAGPGADRERPPRSLLGRLAVLLGAAVVCWTMIAFGLQYLRTYGLAREATRLERHRHDLLVQNGALLREIHRLRTDDQYIEQLARQQLGMLRPGEIELVIVPAAPVKRHSERDPAPAQAPRAADPRDSAREWLERIVTRVRTAAEELVNRLYPSVP